MNEQQDRPAKASLLKRFAQHIVALHFGQKLLLGIALAMAIGGGVMQLMHPASLPPEPRHTTAPPVTPSSPGGRGFVSSDASPTDTSTSPDTTEEVVPAAPSRVPPWMTRVGASLIVGYIAGWLFRVFIKTATLITSVGIAIVMALSYFHVVNVDFTAAAERDSKTAMAWAIDQGDHLRKALVAHLPSSTSATVGGFLGFRRRRAY